MGGQYVQESTPGSPATPLPSFPNHGSLFNLPPELSFESASGLRFNPSLELFRFETSGRPRSLGPSAIGSSHLPRLQDKPQGRFGMNFLLTHVQKIHFSQSEYWIER